MDEPIGRRTSGDTPIARAPLTESIAGDLAAIRVCDKARIGNAPLGTRGMSIGGGTYGIARNQVAERLLGRDPLIR